MMAKRVYYKILSNDGCPQSEEISSLKEARDELREIIKEDEDEFGIHEGEIDYYIEKYTETENTIYFERVE